MQNENQISVTLSREEWQSIVYTLRTRQDDCRRVKEGEPNYAMFNEIDLRLEGLKMKVVKQI